MVELALGHPDGSAAWGLGLSFPLSRTVARTPN